MHSFIKTKLSHCKDCYKCVRHCSVKAIQIKDGHAQIIPERCILDGKCMLICPQGAKQIVSQLDEVKQLIANKVKVIVSLAPSFPSVFNDFSPNQLLLALKTLGFHNVEETSVGAYYVVEAYKKIIKENHLFISSDCPSIVNMIEIYFPEKIKYLAPVVSPMVAHGRLIKSAYIKQYNHPVKVVFVGPCISKMQEAELFPDAIDYVLTFEDIKQWFSEKNILPAMFDQNHTDHHFIQQATARLYPLEGGLINYINQGILNQKAITLTGFNNTKRFLSNPDIDITDCNLIEMMLCEDGCLGGPLTGLTSPQLMRNTLVNYAQSNETLPGIFEYTDIEVNLERSFKNRSLNKAVPSEEDIRSILKQSGKYIPEDELNCGACGYFSCRDKAIAVYEGMASPDMCMPYMRKKAESRANKIIERDPNGVVEVNEQYQIVQYNEAFRTIFNLPLSQELQGKDIKYFLDLDIFKHEQKDKESFIMTSQKYEKELEILTFDLIEDGMHVAIVTDITHKIRNKERIINLKEKTIQNATEVIHKQMRVAQEIASLLGETTAETKVILLDLMKVMREEGKE